MTNYRAKEGHWSEALLEQVAGRRQRSERDKKKRDLVSRDPRGESLFLGRDYRFTAQFTLKFIGWIARAAVFHNMTRTAYIRRVLAIQIAHDLGLPLREVLDQCPMRDPQQGPRRGEYGSMSDSGLNIEDFCSHPGCHGEHLAAAARIAPNPE